jgi:hypothetical protein
MDNLVEKQTVDFSLSDVSGGTLSLAQAVTDISGQATTTYQSSKTNTSAANGVKVTASIPNTSVTAQTSLTVSGQTVGIVLNTTNKVVPYPLGATNPTEYGLPFSVATQDASGAGMPNTQVQITVTSLGYAKGSLKSGTPWSQKFSTSQPTDSNYAKDPHELLLQTYAGCESEDINGDGILIPKTQTGTNDYNGNGKLDPGSIAHTDVPNSKLVTGSDGTSSFNIIYGQNDALWVAVRVTATATVSGTESTNFSDFWLPVAAADIASPTVTPPDVFSPFGQGTLCTDAN